MVRGCRSGGIQQFGVASAGIAWRAGLSQAAFAERADLDRLHLGRLERGRQNPTLLVIARSAVELEVTLAELLGGIEIDADEVRAIVRLSRGPRPQATVERVGD